MCNSVFRVKIKFLAEDEMEATFLQMNKYFVEVKFKVFIYSCILLENNTADWFKQQLLCSKSGLCLGWKQSKKYFGSKY